ncbi:hypothetical protein [Klebsiella pneumoniae IS46]|uniref:Uncharacterized protein n=1 Tax=Klebsiella pneumoniae IS43 TaxID=1432552 RepID=W1DL63_KLEPN|nr:hypothetical protein UUU_44340 [Klebsiella pneumoniae subsp. pneumoniae DSM 30104 = JCM 1662 = NBRC 14940]CDK61991.1 hypothetical protein [Klebsiella pneumoniae IS10]CDL08844.1 hypothetical protein [Klebsiella pneumoniae IS43]CDL17167.1 hypothetical protein [Klebsiella pneumoniae IS46]CDL22039.1 hypothetical protein [Klebsiella pneumoniae IS53]CDL53740.1 hypothetical protein [Klebsiella pneumoniae ISC21]CDL62453.1 hypothetical protein [Klebsiella pneumoniae IS39]
MAIRQAANQLRREKNILRYRVNDHKIVAKAMHFRELHHLLQLRGTERYR